jgi:ribosomal protein S8
MNSLQINFLIHLKNFSILGKESLLVDYHPSVLSIVEFLYLEGLIQSFSLNSTTLLIRLRYSNNINLLQNLKIVSKPSFKKLFNFKSVLMLPIKNATFCLSTPKGLISLNECKKRKQGGVLLFTC